MASGLQQQTAAALQHSAAAPSLAVGPEKPIHFTYLREFRVEACPSFKAHQCHQHRPYTCFYWHFANQRRRRPVRRKDGTFNYSADIYCTKYDESTGLCPDGDDCPYLHRVAGDVERKYHLRYYKTAVCMHATDAKGHCVKNGPHCAFAHSADDLRPPVFDAREVQGIEHVAGPAPVDTQQRDRTTFVVEDPAWQDQEHVVSLYKTWPCRKPPRLCRQGYACPFYHNSKDRRRPPAVHKYRSTPCPSAKAGDEWVEPDACDAGDTCAYCHSRTEQQFHPEIYKSTKCNDMMQHGYCPRGPFCAFAHNDGELHKERVLRAPPPITTDALATSQPGSPQLASLPAAMPRTAVKYGLPSELSIGTSIDVPEAPVPPLEFGSPQAAEFIRHIHQQQQQHVMSLASSSPIPFAGSAPTYSSVLKVGQSPAMTPGSALNAGRPHSSAAAAVAAVIGNVSQQLAGMQFGAPPDGPVLSSSLPKAPSVGSDRADLSSPMRTWTPEVGGERARARTTSLTQQADRSDLGYLFGPDGGSPLSVPTQGSNVAGQALRKNSSEEMLPAALATIREKDENGTNELISQRAMDAQYRAFGMSGSMLPSGTPVAIPGGGRTMSQQLLQHHLAAAPGAQPSQHQQQTSGMDLFHMSGSFTDSAFPSSLGSAFANMGAGPAPGALPNASATAGRPTAIDRTQATSLPAAMPFNLDPTALLGELAQTKEELSSHRAKLSAWEDGLKQARQACEAWKREAETHRARTVDMEREKQQLRSERDAAVAQLATMRAELARVQQARLATCGVSQPLDVAVPPPPPQLEQPAAVRNGSVGGVRTSAPSCLPPGPVSPDGTSGAMCGRCGRLVTSHGPGCSMCSNNHGGGTNNSSSQASRNASGNGAANQHK